MGFQTGTQIRPELANADYSGFANAASIRAQALANLGQEIGEGIQKYQKNKEITAVSLAQLEALGAANPDAIAAVKSAGGDVAKSFSNIEKGDYKQRDVLASLGAMQAYVTEQDRQRQAQAQEQEYQIKAAQLEELNRGPGELKAERIGGFEVISQNGNFKSARVVDDDLGNKLPAGALNTEYEIEQYKKAAELYDTGNTREAQAITSALGFTDGGKLIPLDEIFGGKNSIDQVSAQEILKTKNLMEDLNVYYDEDTQKFMVKGGLPGAWGDKELEEGSAAYMQIAATKGGQSILNQVEAITKDRSIQTESVQSPQEQDLQTEYIKGEIYEQGGVLYEFDGENFNPVK